MPALGHRLSSAVLAVGKPAAVDAHTAVAAGGINAALSTMDVEDSWHKHAADTLKEGYRLGDPRVVQTTVQGAELGIHDLERFGMTFDRESHGRISQRYSGAHKYRRTAFAGGYTGPGMQRALVAHATRLDIPILSTAYIIRILVEDGAVFDAYGFDLVDGSRYQIHADAVILAAGGHPHLAAHLLRPE